MEIHDLVGLAGIIITSVVGPWILARQKANDRKANEQADIHVSNAQVLAALVGAVEGLHHKVDTMSTRPCAGSREASDELSKSLRTLETGLAVLMDRSNRHES